MSQNTPPTNDVLLRVNELSTYFAKDDQVVIFPGLAIFISALAVTLAGQGISLAVDSRSTRATVSESVETDEQMS